MKTTETPPTQNTKNISLMRKIRQSSLWRSIFRQSYPNTDENRTLAIVNSWFLHVHPVKVKRHTLEMSYTLGMGVISFFCFIALTASGILLMFFYVPSVERAYTDMQDLETMITFGMLMRNIHRWGAHLMVVTVFAHMCRVFYTGGYKTPREFNWVIGVLLWIVTLLLSFTGYLLPWDQLAYWAITVSTNIVATIPIIGDQLRLLMLGSAEVGQSALIRFYTLHVILLPLVMTIFIGVHFWRIRKDGGLSNPLNNTDDEIKRSVK